MKSAGQAVEMEQELNAQDDTRQHLQKLLPVFIIQEDVLLRIATALRVYTYVGS